MEHLHRQIRDLDIPYPQKRLLEMEVHHDAAHDETLEREHLFSESDLNELVEIHSTRIYRMLKELDPQQRHLFEALSAFFPLITTLIFITKEKIMIQFIREGGAGMYLILAIGLFLLGREALNVVRLLIIKDHSNENLRIDTSSVLIGCLALMFLGIGWTFLGVYVSASAITQSHQPLELLLIGAKESLTPTILSSLLCALIVLAHYGIRGTLHAWRAPIA
jgi:hypothetical protein